MLVRIYTSQNRVSVITLLICTVHDSDDVVGGELDLLACQRLASILLSLDEGEAGYPKTESSNAQRGYSDGNGDDGVW